MTQTPPKDSPVLQGSIRDLFLTPPPSWHTFWSQTSYFSKQNLLDIDRTFLKFSQLHQNHCPLLLRFIRNPKMTPKQNTKLSESLSFRSTQKLRVFVVRHASLICKLSERASDEVKTLPAIFIRDNIKRNIKYLNKIY